jgi:hypothetical protein
MNNTTSKPMPSRKRKRGKYKNMIVEGDDDAHGFVTFEDVTMDTPGGPITQRVEVPLHRMPECQAGSTPAQMVVDPQSDMCPDLGIGIDSNNAEEQTTGKNKVNLMLTEKRQ